MILPQISVIVPTFNRANIISHTLESIATQTFKNFECIIVDDFSSDNSSDVINKFIRNDSRFRLIFNNRNKGAQGARNTGIISSITEYVVLFDSDDIMHPMFLKKMFEGITSGHFDVCTCPEFILDRYTGKVIGCYNKDCSDNTYIQLLQRKCYANFNNSLIRRQKLIDIGLLDEKCPAYQEWDTHLRLSRIATYVSLSEGLVDYYVGGNDTISKDSKRNINGYLYIMNKFKKEWKPFYEVFRNMGAEVEELLQNEQDKYFIIYSKRKLYNLVPELNKKSIINRMKTKYKVYRHKLVVLIRKTF